MDLYKQKWFDFMEYEPHIGQLRMHDVPGGPFHTEDNPEGTRFTVACCGRRWGKSYSAAREAEIVLSKPNTSVWIVAPNYGTS